MSGRAEFDRLVGSFAHELTATDRVVRDELFAHLDRNDGVLLESESERFAEMAGRTTRTIRRWQKQHVTRSSTAPAAPTRRLPLGADNTVLDRLSVEGAGAFRFDDVMVSLMYLVQGNQLELRRLLADAGYPVPSVPTISRRWKQVNPLVREGAKTGLKHRAAKLLHIRHTASAPNEVWEYDGFSLDIHVRAPRGTEVVRPNALLLVDDNSRFIISHVLIPGAMTGPDVLAAFGAGFELRPAENGSGVLIGGWPDLIITDNEAAIVSGGVRAALEGLPSNLKLSAAFTPTQKGKVERCGKTIQEMVISGKPGRITRSQRTNHQHLLHVRSEDLLSWDAFADEFADAVRIYNYERAHSALGGRTPFEEYSTGWTKRSLTDAELAELMIPVPRSGGRRKVHPDGIHIFGDRYYVDAALADLIGSTVEVRSWHHRTDRVAVFAGDKFVCMASECSHLTKAQRIDIVETRIAAHHAVLHHAAAARSTMVAVGEHIELGDDDQPVEVLAKTKAERLAAKNTPPAAARATTKRRSIAAQPSSRPPKNTTKKIPPKTATTAPDATVRQRARKVAEASLERDQK